MRAESSRVACRRFAATFTMCGVSRSVRTRSAHTAGTVRHRAVSAGSRGFRSGKNLAPRLAMNIARPALDATVVESIRGLQMPGEPNLLERITDAFLEDAQTRLADLRQAMASDDRAQIKRVAHSLKGMCGAIGAHHMAALSVDLERTPLTAPVETGLLSQLEREFTRVRAALRAFVKV